MKTERYGDERIQLEFARNISFEPGNLNLPLSGSQYMNHPVLTAYLIKTGLALFGDNLIAGRSLFCLLFSLSLLFVYLTGRDFFDRKTGSLILVLLVFSQWHINNSRLMIENVYIAFVAPVIYFYLKGLEKKDSKAIVTTGILLGIGFWAKETILLMLPAMILYFFFSRKSRALLKSKSLYFSLFVFMALVFTAVYFSLSSDSGGLQRHADTAQGFGLSLRAFVLYVSEPLYFLFSKLKPAYFYEKFNFSCYQAPLFWPFGLFCLTTVFLSTKNMFRKSGAYRFHLILFFTIFIGVSLVRPKDMLGKFWWASITVYPAVIISGDALVRWTEKKRPARLIPLSIIVIMMINAFFLLKNEELCFIWEPRYRADFLLQRGEHYIKNGNYVSALKRYREIADMFPERPDIYNKMGNVYAAMDDNGKAIEMHRKALELNPQNKALHYNLALDYARKGEKKSAIKHFTTYLNYNPHDSRAYIELGKLYLSAGKTESAISAFSKALSISPENEYVRTTLEELKSK